MQRNMLSNVKLLNSFGLAASGAGGYQAGDCQPQSSANRGAAVGLIKLDLYVKDP